MKSNDKPLSSVTSKTVTVTAKPKRKQPNGYSTLMIRYQSLKTGYDNMKDHNATLERQAAAHSGYIKRQNRMIKRHDEQIGGLIILISVLFVGLITSVAFNFL